MRRACVIGHPVGHSRSPLIHRHWLDVLGLSGAYDRIDVPPDELAAFLTEFGARGYVGGNVTVPHKEAVFRQLGRLSEAAQAMAAVNTLWFDGAILAGDNTDAAGFLANLDASVPGWSDRLGRAVVLGAGGAARAVAHALRGRGVAEIRLANRDRARAEALAGRLRPAAAVWPWADRGEALGGAGLLVNTTLLGMAGQPPLGLDLAALPAHAIVHDIVYVPLATPLLTSARARGLRTVDGLGMLLHQAVPGFERWFGIRPRVTPDLRALIEADIARPA